MRSLILGFIFICFVQPIWGQSNITKTYETWNTIAAEAEVIIANTNTSTISLEELRNLRAYRRARQIPKPTRKYVLQRDNYQCQYCGSQFNLEIDHIFPFSRGGGHEPENLQVLCKNCNLSKSNSV